MERNNIVFTGQVAERDVRPVPSQLSQIHSDGLTADVAVHQPESDEWFAVGVVHAAIVEPPLITPQMLIGSGSTRLEAISSLQKQLDYLSAVRADAGA
jgi:hypothetical protein